MEESAATEISLFDALPDGASVTYTEFSLSGEANLQLATVPSVVAPFSATDPSFHLASFLTQSGQNFRPNDATSDQLLVLNCGQGVSAIVSIMQGWRNVVFTDAKTEILLHSTWPNIYYNCPNALARVKCIRSPSWAGLLDALQPAAASERCTEGNAQFALILLALPGADDTQRWEEFQALLLGHLSSSGNALVCLPTAAFATQALPMHRQIECDTLPGQSGEFTILQLKRRQQM